MPRNPEPRDPRPAAPPAPPRRRRTLRELFAEHIERVLLGEPAADSPPLDTMDASGRRTPVSDGMASGGVVSPAYVSSVPDGPLQIDPRLQQPEPNGPPRVETPMRIETPAQARHEARLRLEQARQEARILREQREQRDADAAAFQEDAERAALHQQTLEQLEQQARRRISAVNTVAPADLRFLLSSTVSMVAFPVDSRDAGLAYLPTIVQSRGLPPELAPSVPLEPEPPPQPTTSSTPAAIPIPVVWDDPAIKRVRRIRLED